MGLKTYIATYRARYCQTKEWKIEFQADEWASIDEKISIMTAEFCMERRCECAKLVTVEEKKV